MPKKKSTLITPEQEADAQCIIDGMTPEQLEEMAAFEKEFSRMPEEMQEALFEFVQQLKEIPVKKREKLIDAFEKLSSLMYNAGQNVDQEDDDDFDDELDSADYPHFLQRTGVLKYTLRVTIKDYKPAIYRKFCVPSNISLRHLSELFIELVGWEGSHLNQFRKGNDYYAPAYQREDEMPVLFGPARNYNQEDFALCDILSEKGNTMEWEYDFGDSWCHDVRLSSIADYKEDEPLVSFIKGERTCPPEDCGGIWGYEELLEIRERWLKYTAHAGKRPSRDEMERLEWYGMDSDFDPEAFDADTAVEICEDYCK